MKLALLCLVAMTAIVYVCGKEQYTDKYDNIDIDQIMHTDRLLNSYFKCLMDRGRCTPDAAELKRVLPEALETHCEKCSEKHKEIAKKFIRYLIKNKPAMWEEVCSKYDPDHKYRKEYEDEIKMEDSNEQNKDKKA